MITKFKAAAKYYAKNNGCDFLWEWQRVVGDVTIGKGLSYQGEIEEVCEETAEKAFYEGGLSVLETLQAMKVEDDNIERARARITLIEALQKVFR